MEQLQNVLVAILEVAGTFVVSCVALMVGTWCLWATSRIFKGDAS